MHLVIANTRSGNGAYRRAEKRLVDALTKQGLRYKLIEIKDLSEIEEILKENLSLQTKLIVSLGGDSTASEIIDSLPRRVMPLLIVPIGKSNTLAQSLGIASLREALQILKENRVGQLRLGKVGEKFFLGSLQIAPRKNFLRRGVKRPQAIHRLLSLLGLTEEGPWDAALAEISLDHQLKFKGKVVSIMVKLENRREEKRGLVIQIITQNEKGELAESLLKGSSLSLQAENALPALFGNDIIATTPLTIKALPRSLPMLVGKNFVNSSPV